MELSLDFWCGGFRFVQILSKKIVSLYNNNSNTNDLLLSAFFLCFAAFWWKAEVLRAELKPQKITLGHELPCSVNIVHKQSIVKVHTVNHLFKFCCGFLCAYLSLYN